MSQYWMLEVREPKGTRRAAIGRIQCADLQASDCVVDDPQDPVGVDFNSLVIDTDGT